MKTLQTHDVWDAYHILRTSFHLKIRYDAIINHTRTEAVLNSDRVAIETSGYYTAVEQAGAGVKYARHSRQEL